MGDMRLVVRTPVTTVLDARVVSLTAEEASGRFGIKPGAEPVVAVLVPSLLVYRVAGDPGENLLAVGSGVLRSSRDGIEVSVRHALSCASLDSVEADLEAREHTTAASMQQAERAFRRLYQVLLDSLVDEERAR